MKFIYHSNRKHPLISLDLKTEEYKVLPTSLKHFIHKWDYPDASVILLASDGNKLAGVFRFSFSKNGERLYASGTWIKPRYRKEHLALKLWKKTLIKYNPTSIYVFTNSHAGHKLVSKLKKKFPDIDWDHCSDFD